MSLTEQIARSTLRQVVEAWDGNIPTWNDFKVALAENKVEVNQNIASQAIYMDGMPKEYFIIYGVITLCVGFLVFPATVVYWIFADISAWWILLSLFFAIVFIRVSRNGHCDGILQAAKNNEKIYYDLFSTGAFRFFPEKQPEHTT